MNAVVSATLAGAGDFCRSIIVERRKSLHRANFHATE